jgi:hypothetical protein
MRWPSLFTVLLFAVLAIHIFLKRNLTRCLCSKSGIPIRGFAIHIQIFLEPDVHEQQGKPVIPNLFMTPVVFKRTIFKNTTFKCWSLDNL